MKKQKRKLMICVIVCLWITAALSGCSKNNKEKDGNTEPNQQETNAEANQQENAENDTENNNQEETGITYPLNAEGKELSFWLIFRNNYLESPDEVKSIQEAEKRTGVHINWATVNESEAREKFGLMIASGSLPDIIYNATFYPNGVASGVEDGLFMELTDLVPENMPHYNAIRESNEQVAKDTCTDDGKLVCLWNLASYNGEVASQQLWTGLGIRQDWLNELSLEIPVTIEDWHKTLTAFKEQYGCKAALQFPYNRVGGSGSFLTAFGIMPSFYQEDGIVKYGPYEEGYIQWLDVMRQWYAEGLIDPNYATSQVLFGPDNNLMANGETGATPLLVGQVGDMLYRDGYVKDPDFYLQPVPNPVLNEGDQSYSAMTSRELIKEAIAISADCKEPELALQWLDYFYSYEGSMLLAYGPEGDGYVIENGEPVLTDMILKNPDGYSTQDAYRFYSLFQSSFGLYNLYPETLLNKEPVDTFKVAEAWDVDSTEKCLPVSMSFTAEESNEMTTVKADVETLVNEFSDNYIMGATGREDYDAFIQNLKQYGVERLIEIYQAALDRYNAR